MNLESTRVPEGLLGSLKNCLVDGDPEQRHGSQKTRRRAILLSIFLQTIAVAALIIFPLLGKGERMPIKIFVERPPYRLGTNHPNDGGAVQRDHHSIQPCLFCRQPQTPGQVTNHQGVGENFNRIDAPGIGDGPAGTPDGVPNGIDPPRHVPDKPQVPQIVDTTEPHRVYVGHIDPAHLVRRIEPIYPHLGVQLRRETRVELHALIATDGSVQSLQVLSGDPLFYQSAIDAVRQWQYIPTLLNGHPVEVDTRITVIYTLFTH
ncbi:MAG TPA: energy transducer TonB [Candidatus Acidoferrum sp.]|jgi:protein TonB